MRIFAIDPGNEYSAYVIWDTETREIEDKSRSKDFGYNISDKNNKFPNDKVLEILKIHLDSGISSVAIEMPQCFGMPIGATILHTCRWTGRFEQCCRDKEVFCRLVYRSQVKMHLCNSMRAKDGNIRQALIDMLGDPGTKDNQGITYKVAQDVWSALAVAIFAEYKTNEYFKNK